MDMHSVDESALLHREVTKISKKSKWETFGKKIIHSEQIEREYVLCNISIHRMRFDIGF